MDLTNILNNFIIPTVEVTIILGIVSALSYFVGRGLSRRWKQQMKWFLKYKIARKQFPETEVQWCYNAIERGVGYYDAKKLLFIHNGQNTDLVYETLYIYDQLILELHKKNKNRTQHEISAGRKFERGYTEIRGTEFPKF